MFDLLRAAMTPKSAESPQLTAREALAAWWQACRPPFLIAFSIPILLAFAFVLRADEPIAWNRLFLIAVCCFLGQTIANFSDDLFDYIQDTDSGENIGGSRVLQTGLISPRQLSCALILLIIATLAIGALLIWMCEQYWLVIPGIFAVLSAIFYVAPPIKYGYRGWGEVLVGINMGLIMVGASVTVLTGKFMSESLALALPISLMVANILYYQSIPEIETDPASGKNTLASRLGKPAAILVFRLSWPIIWLLMLNLWAVGLVNAPVFLGLLTFPLYKKVDRLLHQTLIADRNWLELDKYGHLVRKLYLLNGLALILGTLWKPCFLA